MALYRQIAGIGSKQAANSPVVWNDSYLPDNIFTAIGNCLRSGLISRSGSMAKTAVGHPCEGSYNAVRSYYSRNNIGGFFDGLLNGIAAVSMAVPRNAFLGLVGLNVFGYATKLAKALAIPEAKDKLSSLWEHLGGKFSALQGTINHGAQKKALLKISNGKFVSGAIGNPLVAAAAIAAAASVVAAIMPVISKLLAKNNANVVYPGIDPITGLPTDGSAGVLPAGIMDYLRNPVVIAAGLALGAYYLMD